MNCNTPNVTTWEIVHILKMINKVHILKMINKNRKSVSFYIRAIQAIAENIIVIPKRKIRLGGKGFQENR